MMGHIIQKRIEVFATLSEIVGYKTGLALTRQDIVDHLPEDNDLWSGDGEKTLRLESSGYEALITRLLFRLGVTPRPYRVTPGIVLRNKYQGDPKKIALLNAILEQHADFFDADFFDQHGREGGPIDLTPFMIQVVNRYKTSSAIEMVEEFITELEIFLQSGPNLNFRQQEWKDVIALEDLFKSESLETYYGTFFDQRFIDYLSNNFDEIGHIHWRKFEGLTAEFFDRSGFTVEIGPGRNDDSVDVRVWPKDADKHLPPTMLVQCKRQKDKIEKVVVKALYADILEAQAQSGLIVTTSVLSPGAEKVCTVRAYPITQASRETLKQWITTMRTPYTGVFLG
jgi:restriction system protein